MFFKIGVLKNFTIFTESLFNKVVNHKTCNFIKKRLQRRYFPVNIAKLLRTPPVANSDLCFPPVLYFDFDIIFTDTVAFAA